MHFGNLEAKIFQTMKVLALWFLCGVLCVPASQNVGVYHAGRVSGTEGSGRTFDGIGALSAGATSKLLVNYLEPERSTILDYLFKPRFGAALQILKVEIGGDSQSTDGTESSHYHNSWDVPNFDTGYEWFLMKEAKKRNPNIKLYSLAWAFPGWIRDDNKKSLGPYGNVPNLVKYLLSWVDGAKKYHNLTMDYLGIWNERPFNATAIKAIRQGLDKAGYTKVKLVAADGSWSIATAMLKDKELADSISAVGAHYPGTKSPPDALKTGKPLWASEDYSTYSDNTGGGCLARIINQNFVNGNMTSTIAWDPIASYYDALDYNRTSLMTANQPWSGHYEVASPLWMAAHTTQFTNNDGSWSYQGQGHLDKGGSYVAISNNSQITLVIESMTHNHSQCIRPFLPKYNVSKQSVSFSLGEKFQNITTLHFWHSKLGFNGQRTTLFERGPDLQIGSDHFFTFDLDVDTIVTLTTMPGGKMGPYPPPPPPRDFPLPYSDAFDGYANAEEPFNFAQQTGVFEVHNGSMRQMVLEQPIDWCEPMTHPITIIGNANWDWSKLRAQVKIRSPSSSLHENSADGIFLAIEVNTPHRSVRDSEILSDIRSGNNKLGNFGCGLTSNSTGGFLWLFPKTQRVVMSRDLLLKHVYLNVTNKDVVPDKWIPVSAWREDTRSGLKYVAQVNNDTYSWSPAETKAQNGFAALGTSEFGVAWFDNFSLFLQ